MGKKTPKAPAAPDPKETAAAQSATNKETAYWNAVLNNVNQYTPYGSIEYKQTGDGTYDPNKPPQFTANITLSPEQQKLLDLQNASDYDVAKLGQEQIGRIANAVSTPFSFSGLGDAPTQQDIATATSRAEEALMARMNPQFTRDEEALRTRLINQGIGQNSEAYDREMERFNQARNDARTQAILSGSQYGSDLQNQALQRRQQAINEYTTQRNAPLNEYTALTSGQQIQNPQFQSIGYQGAAAPDYAGMVNQNYQNQLAQYNAKVGSGNSLTSSLFGLGGQLGGAFLGSPSGSKLISGLFK